MKKRTRYGIKTRILAAALTGAVVFANAPAFALAADGNSDPVTIETVQSDETVAEGAVGAAQTSVNTLLPDDTTSTDPANESENKPANDWTGVADNLNEGQKSLGETKEALGEAQKSLDALQSEDSEGEQTGLLPTAAASAADADNAVDGLKTTFEPVFDENGQPVYVQQVGEDGKPVFDDNGQPVYVQQVDGDGKPVVDEDGKPVYVQKTKLVAMVPEVDENGNPVVNYVTGENGEQLAVNAMRQVDFTGVIKDGTTSADNAISSAETARTTNSEAEALAAAQTAREELAGAQAGLLVAENTVKDAEKAVKNAQELYDKAVKDADAALARYKQLQKELSTAQNAADAANERIKAAEKAANALARNAERNKTLVGQINEYWGNLQKDNVILDNPDMSEAEKTKAANDYWTYSPKLCKALLEYYITNGKLTVFDYDEEGNAVPVQYGSDFQTPVDFKVTLMTYSVPENPAVDENGNLILNATGTDYILKYEKGKRTDWKEGNKLKEYSETRDGEPFVDQSAYMNQAEGFIQTGNSSVSNRIAVSFKDVDGNDRVFYFNFKNNKNGSGGSIYFYQKYFTKVYDEVSGTVTVDGQEVEYSYRDEIGVRWDNDLVDSSERMKEEAQRRAVKNGQLAVEAERTKETNWRRFYTNATDANDGFDYRNSEMMTQLSAEYEAAAAEYQAASAAVKAASEATQKLKDDIDRLTLEYNGRKASEKADLKESIEPDSTSYNALKEIEQMLGEMKSRLVSANNELAIATMERNALRTKVEDAQRAIDNMNLSRFAAADDDDDDEDASGSADTGAAADSEAGQTTGAGDTPVNAGTQTDAQDQTAGGAGQDDLLGGGANGRPGAVLGANRPVNKKTVPAVGNKDQKKETAVKNGSDDKGSTKITDPKTPLAATFQTEGESQGVNPLLLLAAIALILAASVYVYAKRKQ